MADDGRENFMAQMLLGGMYGPNQFSHFPGGLSLPGFAGTPTDAMGRPIQSFLDAQKAHDAWQAPATQTPGTTLNSGPTYGLQPSQLAGPSALNPSGNLAFGMANWGGMMSPQARELYANQQFAPVGSPRGTTYANQQPAPAATPPTNPIDMRQAYLDALANPGHVTTPGANVPPTTPVGNQVPSVMSQFLANRGDKPTSGAGNYSNQGFFDTLNALRSQ